MTYIRTLAVLLCLAGVASAAKIDDDIAALKQQLNALNSKVGNLETQNKQLKELQTRVEQLIAARTGDGTARAYSGTVYTALRVALLEDSLLTAAGLAAQFSDCQNGLQIGKSSVPVAPQGVLSCTVSASDSGSLTVTVKTATGTFVNGR